MHKNLLQYVVSLAELRFLVLFLEKEQYYYPSFISGDMFLFILESEASRGVWGHAPAPELCARSFGARVSRKCDFASYVEAVRGLSDGCHVLLG
jgi:hypothetical protein